MLKKTTLVALFLLASTVYSWEDAFEEHWFAISKDSTFVFARGGIAEIDTKNLHTRIRWMDSLFKKSIWPKPVFNFHAGNCGSQIHLDLRRFVTEAQIPTGAIGCHVNGTMKIEKLWKESRTKKKSDPQFYFDSTSFRKFFAGANADTNHYQGTKAKLRESKRQNEIWKKSTEGKAYTDSLAAIDTECKKSPSPMGCLERRLEELHKNLGMSYPKTPYKNPYGME